MEPRRKLAEFPGDRRLQAERKALPVRCGESPPDGAAEGIPGKPSPTGESFRSRSFDEAGAHRSDVEDSVAGDADSRRNGSSTVARFDGGEAFVGRWRPATGGLRPNTFRSTWGEDDFFGSCEPRTPGLSKAAGFSLRAKGPTGPIAAFGQRFARLGPPIDEPLRLERKAAELLGRLFAAQSPFTEIPPPSGSDFQDPPLGPLTFFAPGLGNVSPGAGLVTELARNTDRLVVLFGNPGEGSQKTLRPLTHVRGQRLPDDVQGKVSAIGSEEPLVISYLQDADLTLEQLETIRRSGQIDVVDGQATWVVHSQAALSAVLNRQRLTDAGFGGVFGSLVALTAPFEGSPMAGPLLLGLAADLGGDWAGLQTGQAISELDPSKVKKRFVREESRRSGKAGAEPLEEYVDVAITAHTEAADDGRDHIRPLLDVTDEVLAKLQWIPSILQRDPAVRRNDGVVPVRSMQYGRHVVDIERRAYDHGGTTEDPRLVQDFIVPALQRKREAAA